MHLLDSRALRMSPNLALRTPHADYIGGQQANYCKCYFDVHLDLNNAPGFQCLYSNHGGAATIPEKSLTSALELGVRQ
jgi:hypothetical protein